MNDTPRTDALRNLYDHAAPVGEIWQLAHDLESELTRAMRVVEAARRYRHANFLDDTPTLMNLLDVVEEWEAGR